jgi:murein hydrolase activator
MRASRTRRIEQPHDVRSFCATLAALCLSATLIPPAGPLEAQAPASTPSETRSQQSRRAAERLRALQSEAEALLTQERTLLGELRRLEVERQLQVERLRQFEGETGALEAELANVNQHLASLERTRVTEAPVLRSRIVELYKLGAGGYLRMLLGVDDIRDVGRAYRAVSALAALDRDRARAHQSTLSSLARARDELISRQKKMAELRAQAGTARAAADRALRSRATLVASIDTRRDLNAQLMGELEAARQKLQQTVATLGAPGASPLPIRPFQGALDWPVRGRVVARYTGSTGGAAGARNGIEIAAAEGTPIVAVHEGTVAYAAPFAGFGTLVILDHGDQAFSLYGYLDRVLVSRGAPVVRGQEIGTVGSPPSGSAGLYFELRIDGRAVDPLQWLKSRL